MRSKRFLATVPAWVLVISIVAAGSGWVWGSPTVNQTNYQDGSYRSNIAELTVGGYWGWGSYAATNQENVGNGDYRDNVAIVNLEGTGGCYYGPCLPPPCYNCPPPEPEPEPDADNDGVPDASDNCPNTYNPDQADTDGDGIGDACDSCDNVNDVDCDGVPNGQDNCPDTPNPGQEDSDCDCIGDACDPYPCGPNCPPPVQYVTICHQPGTPAQQTMSVPESAVPGHLGHGDCLGACPPLPPPPEPPAPTCAECKGLTSITLQYNGPAGYYEVKTKYFSMSGGQVVSTEKDKAIVYLQPGDMLYIQATKKDKLPSNLEFQPVDSDGDKTGSKMKIHTSCSKPIDVGMTFGHFTVFDLDKICK